MPTATIATAILGDDPGLLLFAGVFALILAAAGVWADRVERRFPRD